MAKIKSEQHDTSKIDWQAGVGDVAEMVKMGGDVVAAANRRASLDTSTGKVALMTAGKLPWHKLGINVEHAVNSKEAIVYGGMNWGVDKQLQFYQFNGGTRWGDDYALIRTDTGAKLATVGKDYKPLQNQEYFEFLDQVLRENGALYETAGSLFGGRKVFMTAHMPKLRFEVVAGDVNLAYVAITAAHGDGACWVFPTGVRIECANTCRIAERSRSKGIRITHVGNLRAKVREAQEALGLSVGALAKYRELAEAAVTRAVAPETFFSAVLDEFIGPEQDVDLALLKLVSPDQVAILEEAMRATREKRGTFMEAMLAVYGAGKCNPQGTLWAAFNAVTDYADHGWRQSKSADRQLESVLNGPADGLKQIAAEVAATMAV